jgi:hypothetical protein
MGSGHWVNSFSLFPNTLYGNGSTSSSARPVGRWQLEPSLVQDAPDVGFVIVHPALVLDQCAHPGRGPQPAGVAERLGAALERLLNLVQLVLRSVWAYARPGQPACFNPARTRMEQDTSQK